MMRLGLLGVLVFAFLSCELLGGGGGGGTGGGTGSVNFSKGFVYVRKDDRNVYIADESDFQTSDVLTTGAGASGPSLSTNGQRIVFVKKEGTTTSLQTVAVTGGAATTVLTSDATNKNFRHPVFSPDGQTIAFAYDEGTAGAIGLVGVDGSNFQKLIGGGALAYALPSFLPSGTELLAAAGNSGLNLTQLERVNVSTGSAVNVTNTLGNEAVGVANRLAVSPDGTKAVFDATTGSGATRIFVIDLSSKVVTKVNDYTNEPSTNDSAPSWMSATTVGYSSDSGGNDNVYGIGVDGTGRELLLPKAIEAFYGPVN